MQSADKHTSRRQHKSFQPVSDLKYLFRKMTGNPVETDLRSYRTFLEKIKARDFVNFSDNKIHQLSKELIEKGRSGAPPESLLVEAFALVYEASHRAIGLKPYDCQIIAGLAMAQGKIAELPTGEGKTLSAVFPAYLYALSGEGMHILTFNDYLARRDAAWMGPIYKLLGLNVGCVQEGMSLSEKRGAYVCDVTFATAKEAGFDFLRDQICYQKENMVHRPFHMALVDEADSILVDEARIPLIISGVREGAKWDSSRIAAIVKNLALGKDYETDAEHRNVFLIDQGQERLESILGCGSLYDPQNQRLLEAIYCALHAEALLRRDIDYIVRKGKIEIVDEFTGRVVENRNWPDGLQAAVESKEGLARKSEGKILGSITLQHFFKLYPRLCGMTATAEPAADELKEFYGLEVVIVPPNRPSIRADEPDAVFTHKDAKRRALLAEIRKAHSAGRPILAGTASVKESEELATDLQAVGVPCHVLNAKNDELEAGIIAEAGMPGAVTISTNMAGRGTDIKLGGIDESERGRALTLGGLYVIGTNRHESLRIDQQLRGRAGRQGDPGSTRFFISLEDRLFIDYGLANLFSKRHQITAQPEALSQGPIQKDILHAQRIIEGQNFDIRKSLWKYSSLVETQRQAIQDWRRRILDSPNPLELLSQRAPDILAQGVERFGREKTEEIGRRLTLCHIDRCWSDHLAWITDTRETIHLVSLGGKTPLNEFITSSTSAFLDIRPTVEKDIIAEFESLVKKDVPVDLDADALKGPSSTWTYLVNEDQFGWGVEMLKGTNIGFAVGAAAFYGPLFALTLFLNKVFRGKKRRSRA